MRPNQGVLSPGANVEVTILLVDKDQQLLLQNYDKLGFSQEAFDAATKDKFLVQSAGLLKEYEHLSSTSIDQKSHTNIFHPDLNLSTLENSYSI